jgi:hypothetical protein
VVNCIHETVYGFFIMLLAAGDINIGRKHGKLILRHIQQMIRLPVEFSTSVHLGNYINNPPGYLSRYSDWLRAGRKRGRRSSPDSVKNFLFSTSSRPALRHTHLPIQRVPGTLSLVVMRPGREADHSPPTSAAIKKTWIYTSTPPYVCKAYWLIS